ncbi:hypothetical protein SAMN05421579_11658 [Xenorhabdus japonica]|uniref:Uncharacterized protein n=2 Tax=Xenorhabdus japonica TaxID=53341 RepID=A0A1I5B8R5_9GAMM|nr:hypothetical protein SAMN05421579_11658 [Xenorhabdus japonica]
MKEIDNNLLNSVSGAGIIERVTEVFHEVEKYVCDSVKRFGHIAYEIASEGWKLLEDGVKYINNGDVK